jgi:hypothetical protein
LAFFSSAKSPFSQLTTSLGMAYSFYDGKTVLFIFAAPVQKRVHKTGTISLIELNIIGTIIADKIISLIGE